MSDSSNHRVQSLNLDLTSHSNFGSGGCGEGKFNYPRGVAFDSAQNAYVSENHRNTRIQVFTTNGEHLQWLGDTKIIMDRPHDVSIKL